VSGFVLVVMTFVYGGMVVQFQEFSTQGACENAGKAIFQAAKDNSQLRHIVSVQCVSK
jgi:hypothetical protein